MRLMTCWWCRRDLAWSERGRFCSYECRTAWPDWEAEREHAQQTETERPSDQPDRQDQHIGYSQWNQ